MPFTVKLHRGIFKPLIPKVKDRPAANIADLATQSGAPAGRASAGHTTPPRRNLFSFVEVSRAPACKPGPSSSEGVAILLLNAEEAHAAVVAFIENVRTDCKTRTPRSRISTDEEWGQRVRNTLKIAGQLDDGADFVVGCSFPDGQPAGLITLNPWEDGGCANKALEVEDFVTHPKSSGAGSVLVEQAATIAQQQGCGGNLVALVQDGSEGAYLATGFVPDGVMMRLNPASPENRGLWRLQDGKWRLRKHLTKTLAARVCDFRSVGDS